jgi:nucleotidyltransferase/DNA polymerase involved in DNA repair
MDNIFFHVDMDAFYASVEQYDNPHLRGKPVIISGNTDLRSVVSACSYEARKYGIHSAMPVVTARKKCPDGIYLPGRMHRYKEVSETIMKIFDSYTPAVIQVSIKLKSIWGIGKKTVEKLESLNIRTVKQLREYPETLLATMLGPGCSSFIHKAVRGIDPGIFSASPRSRSISNEKTFKEDITSAEILKKNLLELSHQLMFRLMSSEYSTKTVSIKIRYEDFTTVSAQVKKESFITSGEEIYQTLLNLLDIKWDYRRSVRLIGASLMSLEKSGPGSQLELFENSFHKKNKVEKAILELKKKNPEFSVIKAALMKKKN